MVTLAVLITLIAGFWTAGTVTSLEVSLTGVGPGAVALPVEVSETEPWLRSAWLTP